MSSPLPATQAVQASPRVHDILRRLHALSDAQEKTLSQTIFYLKRLFRFYVTGETWSSAADDHMREKFVSLEADKCQLMYLLARSIGAKNIVEAGTSFGVSTIYLALAVGQNVAALNASGGAPVTGKVIATEKEPTKAEKARKYWEEAGEEVSPWIEVRVGDLLETLKVEEGMPNEIDMLLLDIWTPLALPTLKIIRPRLRRGAIVLADNTTMAKPLYKELLEYLHDPKNGFKTTTAPYSGGFEIAVYLPSE
ncbi:related to O-methyltransferase [Cephalotrichum gorgonifer]|uniref:Related to O-methyltransferase n=1 Tax=Cephalotrichum gorgonifer TaxID=2041049 RepID=A0AAE8MSU5_9PEZI|nr:related to O-methyltransferase [Cephalotrichum gorgonifer]